MKRGQLHTGILVLGIVSVVTLFGLVFMLKFSSVSAYGIGTLYGKAPGIAEVTKMPPNYPGGPEPQFPARPIETRGTATPFLVLFWKGYGGWVDSGMCFEDLSFKMPAPEDAFTCYKAPGRGVTEEVAGWFGPISSAKSKLFQFGGPIFCYLNTPYDRESTMNRLEPILEDQGWEKGQINGEDVLACNKDVEFLYPQG